MVIVLYIHDIVYALSSGNQSIIKFNPTIGYIQVKDMYPSVLSIFLCPGFQNHLVYLFNTEL